MSALLNMFTLTNSSPRVFMQALLSPTATQTLEAMPAVADLLSYILVRDPAQRPTAKDVADRYAQGCAMYLDCFSCDLTIKSRTHSPHVIVHPACQ